jgi:hypothetical protein
MIASPLQFHDFFCAFNKDVSSESCFFAINGSNNSDVLACGKNTRASRRATLTKNFTSKLILALIFSTVARQGSVVMS